MDSRLVADSSALVAIAVREPAWELLYGRLAKCGASCVAAPTLLESAMVLWRKTGQDERQGLVDLMHATGTTVVNFSDETYQLAFEAFLRYGKGVHPAGLNFGDCISYATAKQLDAALLFVGDDFTRTDVRIA
jgi:ribonuclease VapC